MRKSAREAKVRTSWHDPDAGYEAAVDAWAAFFTRDPETVADIAAFTARVLVPGRVNALSQVLVHLTAPGVPDVYQGDELWNLTLVDPDNRAPVDDDTRRALLAELRVTPDPPRAALTDPDEPGRPKLWVMMHALALRRSHADWFGPGASYAALAASGPAADRVVAFARVGNVVTVVPRWTLRPGGTETTTLALPPGRWRNVLDGRAHDGAPVAVDELLREFPVALLARD